MPPSKRPHDTSGVRRPAWLRSLDALRDRAAAAFGLSEAARQECVRAMLTGHRMDTAGYWLQLLIAMGIATFGLALDSAAVVIGAMLVSPLMGPLVELGMGVAIGSGVLISRSLFRTVASVVGVIAGAAGLTLFLPFHEVTSEIAARTSPTVLDLFVAVLCAVMAAYTTLRSTSSATSTAAGAAIAIALVPPLSVVGWGIGAARWEVTRGAALLFTANFCAIVLLTVVFFTMFGFDRVAVRALEEQAADAGRLSDRVAGRLRDALGSRYGLLLRWLVPLSLVGAVFVPLRHALEQVVSQVRVRSEVQALVERLAPPNESVHSTVSVAPERVTVRLVILGDDARARSIEKELREGIAKATNVVPTIEVVAVPDLRVLDRFAREHEAKAPAEPPPPSFPDLAFPRRIVGEHLASDWPASAAGPLLSWDLRIGEAAPSAVHVVHFGPPLGAAATDLLGRELSRRVGTTIVVTDDAAPTEPSRAPHGQGASWLAALLEQARFAESATRLSLCVTVPGDESRGGPRGAEAEVRRLANAALVKLPSGRKSIVTGDGWSSRLTLDPCEAGDGGTTIDAGGGGPDATSDAPAL